VQASVGDVIVGASYIHTQPFKEQFWAHGDTEFSGSTRAGCAAASSCAASGSTATVRGHENLRRLRDVMVHRQFMGPVTAVLRAERLDYEADRFSSYPRATPRAQSRLSSMLVAHVNVLHEPPYDA
jgi:hypothetical protein